MDDSESDEEEGTQLFVCYIIWPFLNIRFYLADIDIAPNFVNTKYECLRPTPYVPNYNKKLVSLLLILERKRQLDGEDKRSLSYRHAISAIKVLE